MNDRTIIRWLWIANAVLACMMAMDYLAGKR